MAKRFTPRINEHGRICCGEPGALCPKCAKYHKLPGVRQTAAALSDGPDPTRPSAADQQDHLDRAHDALVSLGAQCGTSSQRGAEGKRNSAADQALLNSAHDHLALAGGACPNANANDETMTTLRAARRHFSPPDPYAEATLRAAEDGNVLDPTMWPGYSPHGTPPDGHKMGLALRHVQQDGRGAAPAYAPIAVIKHASGVPDSYATALAARKGAAS